jgi:CheY-like chemotaxis protein
VAQILIVEDVRELAEEMRSAMGTGHDISFAARSSEAAQRLQDAQVDLVVTALVLETGDYRDGLRVVEAAHDSPRPVPVIVVASYSTPEVCGRAIRAGAFDYIERNSPGIDFVEVLRWKAAQALHPHRMASA